MDNEKLSSGMLLSIVTRMSAEDRLKFKMRMTALIILIISFAVAAMVSAIVYADALKYQADRQHDAAKYQTDELIKYIESLVIETEIIEIISDTGDGGNATAIYGDHNTVAGGDMGG